MPMRMHMGQEKLTVQEIDYDPDRNSAFWSQRPVLVLTRTLQIGGAAYTCMSLRSPPHSPGKDSSDIH